MVFQRVLFLFVRLFHKKFTRLNSNSKLNSVLQTLAGKLGVFPYMCCSGLTQIFGQLIGRIWAPTLWLSLFKRSPPCISTGVVASNSKLSQVKGFYPCFGFLLWQLGITFRLKPVRNWKPTQYCSLPPNVHIKYIQYVPTLVCFLMSSDGCVFLFCAKFIAICGKLILIEATIQLPEAETGTACLNKLNN